MALSLDRRDLRDIESITTRRISIKDKLMIGTKGLLDDAPTLNIYITLFRKKTRRKILPEANPVRFSIRFPEDLIYEILSWLPVKSLIRFRSVCISWYATIESRSFIYKHLKQEYSNPTHDNCLIAVYASTATNELKPIQILLSEAHEVVTYAKLDGNLPYNQDVCGPCDGLYYVWSFDSKNLEIDRGLWNPSLNEYKRLPPIFTKPNLPSNLAFGDWESYGFGFDPVTQDYKVVIIIGYMDETSDDDYLHENFPPSVLVYSLRTNSWIYVADLPKFYFLINNQSYAFANTSSYWLASEDENPDNAEAIIVFDLATNKCRDIQLPEHRTKNSIPRDDGCDYECLMVYQGDIAYVTIDHANKCFDVWVLKEGCWAKKLTIGLVFEVREPLGQWKDGFLVFQSEGGTTLIICNLRTQETWELSGLPLDPNCKCSFISAYQESLVPLPDVINQIHNKYSNPTHDDCLVVVYESTETNDLKPIQIMLTEAHEVFTYAKLDGNLPYNHDVCGPCDGLYYVWSFDSEYKEKHRGLWNPSLNEYKRLPPIFKKPNLPPNLVFRDWESYGFGFDPVKRDYKVVIIIGYTDETSRLLKNFPPSVLVYSLRTNSWRYVADLPKFYSLINNQSYAFANTSSYWLASEDEYPDNAEAIIVFDLATNKCRDIQLPEHRTKNSIPRDDGCDYECLMVYHGDIAYVTIDHANKCFDVWVLKEGCWAKKLTIGLVYEVREPLGHWKDGLLVFQSEGGTTLILCNLDTQETWELSGLPLESQCKCSFICAYQECLVSLPHVTNHMDNK